MNPVLYSTTRQNWCTPRWLVDIIRSFRPAGIGLDPASNPQSPVAAATDWREGALERSWRGHGLVYLNPPYGRGVGAWTRKAREEFADATGSADELLLLLPARVDAIWYQRDVGNCAVCFIKGRIRFLGAAAGATFPSMLVYLGHDHLHFAEHFSRRGVVMVPATSGGTNVSVIHDLVPASPTGAKPALILVEP